jgi:DNA mismatch endonuclease (patch repair protein)
MDTLSPSERSERMSRVRSAHTKPELAVRKLVHSMGFRYRLHRKDLPGKPDLAFTSRRKVIFIHGCYWHQHPDPACRLARLPKSRLEFWLPKFEANRKRDADVLKQLHQAGWKTLVIWECQIRDTETLRRTIAVFLSDMAPM